MTPIRDPNQHSRLDASLMGKLAHDLKSPLSSILGMSDPQYYDDLPEEIQEAFDCIHSSGQALLFKLQNFTSLYAVFSGEYQYKPENFSPWDKAENVVASLKHLATLYSTEIEIKAKGEIPDQIRGSGDFFSRALENLLRIEICSNKIDKITVNLNVSPTNASLLQVSCSGTHRDILSFSVMSDLNECIEAIMAQRNVPVLEMILVQKLCNLMDLQVRMGTDHYLMEFPIPTKQTDKQEKVDTEQEIQEDIRVLLVDDCSSVRKMVKTLLSNKGCLVEEAKDGKEAYTKLQTGVYDLCIIDLGIPVFDGYQVAEKIRWEEERSNKKKVIFIALTGESEEGNTMSSCISRGISNALFKPLDTKKLYAMLAEYFPQKKDFVTSTSTNEKEKSEVIFSESLPNKNFSKEVLRTFSGGNPGLAKKVISTFLEEDGPHVINELREALLLNDSTRAERAAHNMKGAVSIFSKGPLCLLCEEMERLAGARNRPGMEKAYRDLESNYRELRDQLLSFIEKEGGMH